MPPRPSRASVVVSAPDPNNLLLNCVQCRRRVEILNPATGSGSNAARPSKEEVSEAVSRSLYTCALSSSQDLPLCTTCWKQRLTSTQQESINELSSLVETLSTVRGISPTAIAAFKDMDVDVDALTQQYNVIAAAGGAVEKGNEEEEVLAAKLDDEQYERERAELERELLETEQELAGKRKEVKLLQGGLSKLNAEADAIERQLNGVALQESAVESAAQSAASRLQTAKAGFGRLGLAVNDVDPAHHHNHDHQSPAKQQTPSGPKRAEALSTSVTPAPGSPQAAGHDGLVVAATVSDYDSRLPENASSNEEIVLSGQVAAQTPTNRITVDDRSVPEGSVVSASLEGIAAVPTMALFAVSSSQVNFDSMNNVSSATNLSSVLTAAFHLEFDDNIARVNGRRVGRLNSVTPVPDEEINAGCGFLALLMNYLLNTYTRMEKTRCSMDAQGCASTITVFEANQKRTVVDFHIKRRFFSWSTFGQAWVIFSNCTNEVVQSISNGLRAKAQRVRSNAAFAPSTASAQLVQRIDEHIALLQSLPKISQNGLKVDDDSVKYGDASDPQWTSAVRGLIKLLQWASSADKYLS